MDFNQVRYFLALADTLNFTRAAERCHVTQPALTQSIRRLEDSLNGKLIDRDGRATQLTELGQAVRIHFEKIDYTRRLVHQTANDMSREDDAELNIGVVCTLGSRCLLPLFEGFKPQVGAVALTLHEVTPLAWPNLLKTGAIDGVFCSQDQQINDDCFEYQTLFQERVGVAFSSKHVLANSTDDIPAREVFEHPYVDRLDCEFRDLVLELCEREQLDINVVCRSQREDWIQRLVAQGIGVTIIPEYSVVAPDILVRRLSDPSINRTVALALPQQADQTGAVRELSKKLRLVDWSQYQP